MLTATGKAFLVEAKSILSRVAAAETVLDDLAGLQRGHLALAASQTIANYWLPAFIHRFNEAHPAITLQLSIGNTEQVASLVREGSADLGFVEGRVDDPLLVPQAVAEDELVLVGPVGHALCDGKPVTVRCLEACALGAARAGLGHARDVRAGARRARHVP